MSDAGLRADLETNRVSGEWPRRTWEWESLTLAAFYFSPEVEGRVGRIARELELPRSGSSILRKHLASLQLLSIDLYATLRSSGLRGYGEVAPATARYLEKEIPLGKRILAAARAEGQRTRLILSSPSAM